MLSKKSIALTFAVLFNASASAHSGGHDGGDRIRLSKMGSYKSGPYDKGAAEIVAYHAKTQRAFITNGHSQSIDVISMSKPELPSFAFDIDLKPYGQPNSVAVSGDLVAVAVQSKPKQAPGSIVIFDIDGVLLNTFEVGSQPDMVTFSPDGKYLLAANEGEPNDAYTNDPEGSISIIEVSANVREQDQGDVKTADFKRFNTMELDPGIRVFGLNASVAQDLEPEYITVSADSKRAWVALQENNALAIIDIENASVSQLIALGTQSHNSLNTAIDASDEDQSISIRPWPVEGMFQPDTIASYEVDGKNYIVSANEGDARDYEGYSEETRVAKMTLTKSLRESSQKLIEPGNLGRLKVSTVGADADGDGQVDTLYSFGTRSFSIWDETGQQVFDSGAKFARIVARDYPKHFNNGDGRSDNKGSEPEALALGKVGDATYAFIGLERTGGVMVYNISDPRNAFYVYYLNTISSQLDPKDPKAGDIGPESIVFVSAERSPTKKPFLITANEVSGTVSTYSIMPAAPKHAQ